MTNTRTPAVAVVILAAALTTACVSSGPQRSSGTDAARANTQLAHAYLQRGDVNLAMEKVDKALEQDDEYAEAYLVKGMILARAEEFDDADDYYLRAARYGDGNAAVLSNVAAYLCQRERRRDGERMFLEVASMPTNPRPAVALTNAGLCAKRIPALERAEAHLRRALQQEPNYAYALWRMAELSFEQGDALAARAFLQRYESVQRLGPEGLWLGVRVERHLGDRAAERRYADILLRDFPDSAEARRLTGGTATNGDAND